MTKIPLLEAKYNAAVTRRPSKATVYVYQNAMAGRYKVTENGWEWVMSRESGWHESGRAGSKRKYCSHVENNLFLQF